MTAMVGLHGSIGSAGVMDDGETPDLEVSPRASRRRFAAEYKARILAEYERLPDGERGALLRREGLYSSLISQWRKQAAGWRGRGAQQQARPVRSRRQGSSHWRVGGRQ